MTKAQKHQYLLDNRKVMTVPQLAKELGMGAATIYKFFRDRNLGWTTAARWVPPKEHQFRKMNRSLKAQIIEGHIYSKSQLK